MSLTSTSLHLFCLHESNSFKMTVFIGRLNSASSYLCVRVCLCMCSYYKGIRQMVPVSDQDMNTHLAEVSRVRNTAVIFWRH